MKAVQLTAIGRPLQERSVPVPGCGPEDVLIQVKAAGICHSDAHYRAGNSSTAGLPLTLGHEIAGIAIAVGQSVKHIKSGDRVCVHYLATCGECHYCASGHEQFCATGQMIGKHRDGGFAEYAVVPGRSVLPLPDEIPFSIGAVMMCSSSTALHALRKARFQAGETVALFGFGGLGFSALQLALAMGARKVYVVDIDPVKLRLAEQWGGVAIQASSGDAVKQLRELTGGRGVDVALELIGLPETMDQAVRSLAVLGRAALAGLTPKSFSLSPYTNLINREAEVIGVSDHLATEITLLLKMAADGQLQFPPESIQTVALDADAINAVLDKLEKGGGPIRTVITPEIVS